MSSSRIRAAMRALSAACLALSLSSCYLLTRPTVTIERLDPRASQARVDVVTQAAVHSQPSVREALHSFDLDTLFEKDPDEALRRLHACAVEGHERSLLSALAEISFARATDKRDRDHYLAAAIYAYLYLFGDADGDPPDPYDRRFRRACDIYNVALEMAFRGRDAAELVLHDESRKLPVGSVNITVDTSHLATVRATSTKYLSANEFAVHGLSVDHRISGLGVAVIALPEKEARRDEPRNKYLARAGAVPATAFLRLDGGVANLEQGLTAKLEIYDGRDAQRTSVGKSDVPLEVEYTTALAYALQGSDIWRFSLTGFLSGEHDKKDKGLVMVRPYQPGRVPVVFVHGTASSPAYWAEMFNTLEADPALRGRIQFWFFKYPTGNPVAYSSTLLREALLDAVHTVDPEGRDEALKRMVVIGHSQGGLLARMMATDGDMSWLDDILGRPLAELNFSDKQMALLHRGFDFDPVPQVSRVVFIATPHRGSFLTQSVLTRWVAKLIALPGELVNFGGELRTKQEKLPKELRNRIPTALDNMNASNPFLQRLGRAPIAPGVTYNSIVAVKGKGPIETGNDGVVEYTSAHVDGAESEFVVRCGHSCQQHPLVIREVRRILLEQLGEP